MAKVIRIDNPDDERIASYRNIRERDLVGRQGRFIAEGKVVLRALLQSSRFSTESILLLENRVQGLRDELMKVPGEVPVFVASREIIDRVAGFPMHRGILAIGRGEPLCPAENLLPPADRPCRLVVCAGIANHDNIGSIFRNAAAFGVDAVLLDRTCCDPLYRKALRVSVGAVLQVPFTRFDTINAQIDQLESHRIKAFALTPSGEIRLEELLVPHRAAIVLGSEGDGLPPEFLGEANTVRISMTNGFDSVNVAAASAIALHHFATGPANPGPEGP